MSMFCAPVFLKECSQAEAIQIISELKRSSRCFVSPRQQSWIEVYDEISDEMDIDNFEEFMSMLCARSGTMGISIWVVGSYYLCFWAYDEKGELIVSHIPDDSEPMKVPDRIGLGGPLAEFISIVCGEPVTDEWIERELNLPKEQSDLEGFLYQLCEALHIPAIGFSYGDFDFLYDLQDDELKGYMAVERDGSCSGPLP